MASSIMSEEQGDKIIQLLEDVLWELKELNTNVDRMDNNVSSIAVDVAHLDK